jgi:aryl carrier-like protein
MQLDEMPLNANGKIDKKALPEVTIAGEDMVPPENETQEWILEAAIEATGNPVIGITTDLFEAGLSSIGCIRLCAMIKEKSGRVIKTSELFENNTIRDIEKLIDSAEEEKEYELLKEYPLSMTQTGIYIECMRYPGSTTYNIPELYKLGAGVDTARFAAAIEKAAAAHPYLFMDPVRDKDGTVHAVRRDELSYKAPIIKCDSLPTEDELVRSFSVRKYMRRERGIISSWIHTIS